MQVNQADAFEVGPACEGLEQGRGGHAPAVDKDVHAAADGGDGFVGGSCDVCGVFGFMCGDDI